MIIQPTEQTVFEPNHKHMFFFKIPGIPTYMVKSYSDLTWRGDMCEKRYEIDDIHIELYDAVTPNTKSLVYENIISKGTIIPEILIEIIAPTGNIIQTITLRDNTVISVNMGNGDVEDDDLNIITLNVQPRIINFS